MKKILFVLFIILGTVGITYAATPVTDCSTAQIGDSCIQSGEIGTCAADSTIGYYCATSNTSVQTPAAPVSTQTSQTQTVENTPQGFTALAPIPGLTDQSVTSVINSTSLANFFNNLYKYLIGIAAILAVIEIIWAGIEIATNQDSVSKMLDGKGRISNAIFGLVLVLSPALVFSIINPSILNLSLNLPAIKTVQYAGTVKISTNTVPITFPGCKVTGTLFKTAICTTQQAAKNFAAACTTGPGDVPFFTTQHKATCGTTGVGPYAFKDTSSGVVSYIVGYSHYEPLASFTTNPNNGNDVLQFASTCTADGGTTCLGTLTIPCAVSRTTCWGKYLSCTEGDYGAGSCSSNPKFVIVNN